MLFNACQSSQITQSRMTMLNSTSILEAAAFLNYFLINTYLYLYISFSGGNDGADVGGSDRLSGVCGHTSGTWRERQRGRFCNI